MHYHQIGHYVIIHLKFPSVKKDMLNVNKDKIFSRVKSIKLENSVKKIIIMINLSLFT